MPYTIIPRAMPIADVINRFTDSAQIERMQDESARAAERRRQKRLGITAAVSAATLGAGLVAAPAIAGVAGAAATSGAAATTGMFGAGGAISGMGALQLAGLGASVGGQIADEDYGGAGNSVFQIARQVAQSDQDQKMFGYSPTDAERSMYMRQAIEHGLDPAEIMNTARSGGMKIPQQLKLATQQTFDSKQWQQIALDQNLPYTGEELKELASTTPGGISAFVADFKANAMRQEDQRKLAFKAAELDEIQAQKVQEGELEYYDPPEALSIKTGIQQEHAKVIHAYKSKDLTQEQYADKMAELAERYNTVDRKFTRPKTPKLNIPGVGEVAPGQVYKQGYANWSSGPNQNGELKTSFNGWTGDKVQIPYGDKMIEATTGVPKIDPDEGYKLEWDATHGQPKIEPWNRPTPPQPTRAVLSDNDALDKAMKAFKGTPVYTTETREEIDPLTKEKKTTTEQIPTGEYEYTEKDLAKLLAIKRTLMADGQAMDPSEAGKQIGKAIADQDEAARKKAAEVELNNFIATHGDDFDPGEEGSPSNTPDQEAFWELFRYGRPK